MNFTSSLSNALSNTTFTSGYGTAPKTETSNSAAPRDTFTSCQSLDTADQARKLAQMAQEMQANREKNPGGMIGSDMAFHLAMTAQMQQLELINKMRQSQGGCPPTAPSKAETTTLQMAHQDRLRNNMQQGGLSAANKGEIELLKSLQDERHGPDKDVKELMAEQQQWNSITNAGANFGLGAAVGKQAEIIDSMLADGKGGGILGKPVVDGRRIIGMPDPSKYPDYNKDRDSKPSVDGRPIIGMPDPSKYPDYNKDRDSKPSFVPDYDTYPKNQPGIMGGWDSPMFHNGKVITRREYQQLHAQPK